MSDVVVSVTESTTNVTVTEPTVAVDVTENVVQVSATSAGIQGATGPQGASYTPGDPIYVTVRNATGSTITKGQIVYTSGGNGVHTQVSLALATSDATSARVLGWMAEDVNNNASGLCQVEGYLDGVDTQSIAEGTQLYLSGTVAGGFQTSKPQAPVHLVYVGVAVKASAGNGKVYVKVQNGYELDELHDVQITSKTNNDLIKYDSATSLWKNVQPSSLTVGTATYATTSGTATYATTSGTAVFATSSTFSGTATYASTSGSAGTAANAGAATNALYATNAGDATTAQTAISLSGTVTQSQVTALTTDLANRAVLNASNTFTAGEQIISNNAIGNRSLVIKTYTGQTALNIDVRNAADTGTLFSVDSSGQTRTPAVINPTTFNNSRIQLASTGTIIDTQVSTNKPLIVKGAASQSANFFEIQTSSGSTAIAVNNANSLLFGPSLQSFLSGANGRILAVNTTATVVPLTVQGAASQSANLQEWQDSSGGTAVRVSSAGVIETNQYLNMQTGANAGIAVGGSYRLRMTGNNVQVETFNATTVPLVVKGAASQTSDLQQHQSSAAVVLGGRNALGQIYSGSTAPLQTAVGSGVTATTGTGTTATITTQFNHNLTVGEKITVTGVNPAGYNGTFIVTAVPSTTQLSYANATTGAWISGGVVSIDNQASIVLRSPGTTGLSIRGNTYASGILQSWQLSDATEVTRVRAGGQIGIGSTITGTTLAVNTDTVGGASSVGVTIRGAASQTADLTQWQNSGGTVLVKVDSAGGASFSSGNATITSGGIIRGLQVSTNVDYSSLREENSGGLLRLTKQTAAAANPASGQAKIYLRDGTNAGTLKLVIRAGAAGAETTILDNIPQ